MNVEKSKFRGKKWGSGRPVVASIARDAYDRVEKGSRGLFIGLFPGQLIRKPESTVLARLPDRVASSGSFTSNDGRWQRNVRDSGETCER